MDMRLVDSVTNEKIMDYIFLSPGNKKGLLLPDTRVYYFNLL